MKQTQKVYASIELEREVEIKWYVEIDTNMDAHFKYEPPHVLNDKYFDTKEEAEEYERSAHWAGITTVLSKKVLVDKRKPTVEEIASSKIIF